MNRMDCDRMFVAVIDTGSFAAAAAKLHTSAGQASKLVSKLEAELGVRLLNRTTRALSLTEVGQAYFARIRDLLDELDALDLSVRSASQTPRGRLRITTPLNFGSVQLAPILNTFAKMYPEILLDVQLSDRVANLVDEGFDAAIRIGRPSDSSLIARKLSETSVVCVATPEYLEERGTPKIPDDLVGHDCIIDSNFRDPYVWKFLQDGVAKSVPVKGRLQYSNGNACLVAAEQGLGIARIPDFLTDESCTGGRLVQVLADFQDEPMGIYVMYPPTRHLATKVRVLVDYLVANYRS